MKPRARKPAAKVARPRACCVAKIAHEAEKVFRALAYANETESQLVKQPKRPVAEWGDMERANHLAMMIVQRTQNLLNDRLLSLQDQASYETCRSADGALFQLITIAIEAEGPTQGGEQRINRCVQSINDWLIEAAGAALPAISAYNMPRANNPLVRLAVALKRGEGAS